MDHSPWPKFPQRDHGRRDRLRRVPSALRSAARHVVTRGQTG
ncbi:hypothetical protein [Streptomyces albiaxialis]